MLRGKTRKSSAFSRPRSSAWRRWGTRLALLTLAGCLGCYLWEGRDFLVDDTQYAPQIAAAAQKYALDSRLVRAVIYEESRFRAGAKGGAGEIGLMQILPQAAVADWARRHQQNVPETGVLFSPQLNLEIGCWYLSEGLKRYRNYDCATELALCRYNAGQSRADAWRPEQKDGALEGRIAIESTDRYVRNIMKRYRNYCKLPD